MTYHNPNECRRNFNELAEVASNYLANRQESIALTQLRNCIEGRISVTNALRYGGKWDYSHVVALNHVIQLYDFILNNGSNINNIKWDNNKFCFIVIYQSDTDIYEYTTTSSTQTNHLNLRNKYFKYKKKYLSLKNKIENNSL